MIETEHHRGMRNATRWHSRLGYIQQISASRFVITYKERGTLHIFCTTSVSKEQPKRFPVLHHTRRNISEP